MELVKQTDEKARGNTVPFPTIYCWENMERQNLLCGSAPSYNTNFDWANESNKGVSITAVETYCRLSRLRYTGHVARMGENRIPNLILHGEILQGQRKQGRPKKSFREGLKNDLHKFDLFGKYSEQNTFQEFVADRDKWRKMINKQAQFFEKNWEKNKVKKSNTKKEKNKTLNQLNIILLCVFPIAYIWPKGCNVM